MRSFCYIRDEVKGMLYVLFSGKNGEPYNVGNDVEEVSMAQVAQRLARAAAPPMLEIQYKVSADQHYLTDNPQRRCPDLKKLRSLAPWNPEVGLDEGLSRTLQSYR
jgi:dTDP-glucose 4,6-dehydratase/UDP-glucuronate decarboxylase